jgi:lipoprotein-releasing system permease protein
MADRVRTRGRWAMVRLVAARLAVRERPPSLRMRRALPLGVVACLAGLAAIALGVAHLAIVVVVGVGGMIALVAAAVRLFPPATAVSVVGVALGCASLMTALSVTGGFQREITRALARFNGHVLITKYGLDFAEYEPMCATLLEDARVTAASPFAYSAVAVVGLDEDENEEGRGPTVVIGKGIDPERAADLDGLASSFGRGDLTGLRPGGSGNAPGVVLGRALARVLDVDVGDKVRLVVPAELDGTEESADKPPRHATFEVLDILDVGIAEFDREIALVHLTAAQALFFREGRITGIELELVDPELAEQVAEELAVKLPEVYRVSTWRDANSALLIGLAQIRVVLSLVLGLMVVVAASSLIASLLLLVRRKHHDVAVLMALGGDGGLVFWVFEVVGVLAGAVGAVLGVALGAVYCAAIAAYHYPLVGEVYPVDHLPVALDLADALGPAVAAVALCALASGPVAALAARTRILAGLNR